jgi:2-polyprenyl-3-methyl-5-hydroxy-6-metoxy-1,4-benzoquinol methylase
MSLLLRFVSWSVSFPRRVYKFTDGVISGFWLGVLGEKNIEKYNDLHYNQGHTYRDDKWNLSGLQGWEYERIKKHFSKSKTFLLIGAGGGRETAALSNWGAEVDSYECSGKLVEYGNDFLKRNNIDATISFLPKNSVDGITKKYHGIILGWGAYSHIQDSSKRIAFLSALHPFCTDDTHIMISFLVKDGQGRKDKLTMNVSNFFRYFRKAGKTENGDRLLSYFAHFFDKKEIEYELSAARFSLIEYSDSEYGCAVGKPNKNVTL